MNNYASSLWLAIAWYIIGLSCQDACPKNKQPGGDKKNPGCLVFVRLCQASKQASKKERKKANKQTELRAKQKSTRSYKSSTSLSLFFLLVLSRFFLHWFVKPAQFLSGMNELFLDCECSLQFIGSKREPPLL